MNIWAHIRVEIYVIISFTINILCLVSYGDDIKDDTSDGTPARTSERQKRRRNVVDMLIGKVGRVAQSV